MLWDYRRGIASAVAAYDPTFGSGTLPSTDRGESASVLLGACAMYLASRGTPHPHRVRVSPGFVVRSEVERVWPDAPYEKAKER